MLLEAFAVNPFLFLRHSMSSKTSSLHLLTSSSCRSCASPMQSIDVRDVLVTEFSR